MRAVAKILEKHTRVLPGPLAEETLASFAPPDKARVCLHTVLAFPLYSLLLLLFALSSPCPTSPQHSHIPESSCFDTERIPLLPQKRSLLRHNRHLAHTGEKHKTPSAPHPDTSKILLTRYLSAGLPLVC